MSGLVLDFLAQLHLFHDRHRARCTGLQLDAHPTLTFDDSATAADLRAPPPVSRVMRGFLVFFAPGADWCFWVPMLRPDAPISRPKLGLAQGDDDLEACQVGVHHARHPTEAADLAQDRQAGRAGAAAPRLKVFVVNLGQDVRAFFFPTIFPIWTAFQHGCGGCARGCAARAGEEGFYVRVV